MPIIIHIHGGETRKAPEEYTQFLKNKAIDIHKPYVKRRSRRHDEIFPNIACFRPEMPCSRNAKYINRKIRFEKYLDQLSGEIILIGHSLGANFTIKRLSENNMSDFWCTLTQLHLVAWCFGRNGNFEVTQPWSNISQQTSDIHIYHSTDDDEVDFAISKQYTNMLPDATFHSFNDRWHFLQTDFPELRDIIRTHLGE